MTSILALHAQAHAASAALSAKCGNELNIDERRVGERRIVRDKKEARQCHSRSKILKLR